MTASKSPFRKGNIINFLEYEFMITQSNHNRLVVIALGQQTPTWTVGDAVKLQDNKFTIIKADKGRFTLMGPTALKPRKHKPGRTTAKRKSTRTTVSKKDLWANAVPVPRLKSKSLSDGGV